MQKAVALLCPSYACYRMCLRDNGTACAVSVASGNGGCRRSHVVVVRTWSGQKCTVLDILSVSRTSPDLFPVSSDKSSLFQSGCEGNPSSCCGPYPGTILEKCKAPTNIQSCLQARSTSKFFLKTVQIDYIVLARVAC
jgi:hypothetical protein